MPEIDYTLSIADSSPAGGLGLQAEEPVINRQLDLTVEDNNEILVIPEVAQVEFLLVPIDSFDEMPPIAELPPLQTTIENGELVHTHVVSDTLLNTVSIDDSSPAGGLGLQAEEPVINRQLDFTVEDNNEILVIPEVAQVEYLLVPIDSFDEMPPIAELPPLQTTIENGELAHTPIVSEIGLTDVASL